MRSDRTLLSSQITVVAWRTTARHSATALVLTDRLSCGVQSILLTLLDHSPRTVLSADSVATVARRCGAWSIDSAAVRLYGTAQQATQRPPVATRAMLSTWLRWTTEHVTPCGNYDEMESHARVRDVHMDAKKSKTQQVTTDRFLSVGNLGGNVWAVDMTCMTNRLSVLVFGRV